MSWFKKDSNDETKWKEVVCIVGDDAYEIKRLYDDYTSSEGEAERYMLWSGVAKHLPENINVNTDLLRINNSNPLCVKILMRESE